MSEIDERLSWPLTAYGRVIRGDTTTSEDQIAIAETDEIAVRMAACWNGQFSEIDKRLKEREVAVAALRELCGEYGDNDWADDLHLADVIEKHLRRHLDAKQAAPQWADKPTVPGLYWLSYHPGSTSVMVTWFGDDYYDQDNICLNVNNPDFPKMAWLGPIDVPERPA